MPAPTKLPLVESERYKTTEKGITFSLETFMSCLVPPKIQHCETHSAVIHSFRFCPRWGPHPGSPRACVLPSSHPHCPRSLSWAQPVPEHLVGSRLDHPPTPSTCSDLPAFHQWKLKKPGQDQALNQDKEIGRLLCCWWECNNGEATLDNSVAVPQTIKQRVSTVIPLLGVDPREMKTHVQ